MRERDIFVDLEAVAAVSFGIWAFGRPDVEFRLALIYWLAAVVLCAAELLVTSMRAPEQVRAAFFLAVLVLVFFAAGGGLMPAAAVFIPAVAQRHMNTIATSVLTAAALASVGTLVFPGAAAIALAALFAVFTIYILRLLSRREEDAKLLARRGSEIEGYKELMQSQRRMTQSLEQVSRLTERNRLAARIHDEIGHGMSGSILLLEGAAGVMDKNPEMAKDTVKRVAENLRVSVDDIRAMLREERSPGSEVSVAKIENELNRFSAEHPGIRTEFVTAGDLAAIRPDILQCVYENMTEAFVNMLKHSKSTLFRLSVTNGNKLVKAEIADNGGAARDMSSGSGRGDGGADFEQDDGIRRGIGLQNMEERCALCYGRCFFRKDSEGFRILMTFPIKETPEAAEN